MFLRSNHYPDEILWVEKRVLVWGKQQLWIRDRASEAARKNAEKQYSEGINKGFGVQLHAFSEAAGKSAAVVLSPDCEDASQRLLMPRRNLKLSAAVNKLPARLVHGRMHWLFLSLRFRTSSQLFWTSYFDCS